MQPYAQPLPPRKSNFGVIIAAVVAGVILLCGGAVAVLIALPSKSTNVDATRTTAPAVEPTVEPTTSSPSPSPSASPSPTVVAMPNLVNKNAAVAGDELKRAGFTRVEYGSRDPSAKVVVLLSNWTVVDQSVKAGAQVSTDTLIVLGCKKG
jgi:hypothetical protein